MTRIFNTSPEHEEAKKHDPDLNNLGHKKLWNYFLKLTETQEFQEEILKSREKFSLPKEGLDWETIKNHRQEQYIDTSSEAFRIATLYKLDAIMWEETLHFYIECGVLSEPEWGSSCLLTTVEDEVYEPYSKFVQDIRNEVYPIFLRISPYATQREIIDFVKMQSIYIKKSQKKYQDSHSQIGKSRTRKEGKISRNQFIFEHKDLPRKEIMHLVTDKFAETLDYGHIGKIISLESKKREKK